MTDRDQAFDKLINLQHMMGAYHHKRMMQHGPMADSTRGKGRVLALLKMADGISTKDMATVLGIRVSSLNETLARLEADGYVERRPSEEDGRVMLVYLTDKGKAEQQPETDFPAILFADFDEDMLETLDGHLDLMTKALEKELGEDWREHMEHMRHRREKIFHQAGGPRCGHGPGHGPGRSPRGPFARRMNDAWL